VGITIIGRIAIVGGAFAAFAAASSFIVLVLGVGVGGVIGAVFGVFALALLVLFGILGALGIATGWGLLKGRSWSRILLMVLMTLNALWGVGMVVDVADRSGVLPGLVGIGVSGVVGWYLFRPEVKHWFLRA
jgi:hypothetical protein